MNAIVSPDGATLWIDGDNFGDRPFARLGGVALAGVKVDKSGRHLVASLPALRPGTYLLEVYQIRTGANRASLAISSLRNSRWRLVSERRRARRRQ